MADIRLRGLTKRYGNVTAVDSMDLEIPDGEFFALLGPSGCGKTTTMRLIAGLEQPTAGTVHLGSRDVTHLPPQERNVAMVFQDYALYPHMTVFDNIAYPLKVRKVPRAEIAARVKEVALNLQLENLLERLPGQLSGGQQQRTAVGRALVHRADCFLFDEPLSNLDAKLRFEARAFLKRLQQDTGVTTIFVTHDQSEAMALADRIGIMDKGRLMQVGTPLEIYRRPQNLFVAGFIGSPPMNLIPCRIEVTSDRARLSVNGMGLDVTPFRDGIAAAFPGGGEAVLGIRPEHLDVVPQGEDGVFGAEVYTIAPLGNHVVIYVRVGDHLATVVQFTDDVPRLPRKVGLRPQLRRLYLYRTSGELAFSGLETPQAEAVAP
ncbi:MAG TPA: ABC transporter ATP-binding protein [Limnochordales bacterium]|nr:ABC transporter ATP-binding protein [Limnochordales bacterium]